MEVVIPVTLVTLNEINNNYIIIISAVLTAGIRLDIFTKLEKVELLSGTGEATTLAAISVM